MVDIPIENTTKTVNNSFEIGKIQSGSHIIMNRMGAQNIFTIERVIHSKRNRNNRNSIEPVKLGPRGFVHNKRL